MSVKRKAADLAAADAKKPKANGNITAFFGAPKPAAAPAAAISTATTTEDANGTSSTAKTTTVAAVPATAAAPAAAKFDKEKWVASLTDEQRDLLKLEIDTLDETWLAALKDEITTKNFLGLKRFLEQEKASKQKVFPPEEDIYSWSRHCPLSSVKVVIVGQDPYHNVNQAHGLSFSVRPPTPAPPSLMNIYKALKKDYPDFQPPANRGGLLTPWADRGVLLLNACLTVRAHQANSHQGRGWERFTQRVLEIVAERRKAGVVFLAWGAPAKKRVSGLAKGGRHCILESVHPSPLSAERGFFDCKHFVKTNQWLKQRYGEDGQIDWNLNAKPEEVGV